MSTGDERTAARDEARRALAANWDRVGRYLQSGGDVGAKIVQRNLDAWASVSRKLNKSGYNRDDLITDAMNLLVTMTRNAEDIWRGMTAPPGNDNVALAVPTAFLFFRRIAADMHELVDPITIRVPGADDQVLPDRAQIALSGTVDKATGVEDATGVTALHRALSARSSPGQPGVFLIQAVADPTNKLISGTYDGFVYILGEHPCPLANLRIIVEGDTTDSPRVSRDAPTATPPSPAVTPGALPGTPTPTTAPAPPPVIPDEPAV
jgi:hypothetical protein